MDASDSVAIGNHRLPIWPTGQRIESYGESVYFTWFSDWQACSPAIVRRVHDEALRVLQADPPNSTSLGGVKVFDMLGWGLPEYDLIHARACEFYRRVLRSGTAAVDHYWANYYRQWDSAGPHSHRRSTASVVYYPDVGDDTDDPWSGRLCFADPRLDMCCKGKPGYLDTPAFPPIGNGVMIIFPSHYVHHVPTYGGTRPRVSIAWNINSEIVPGDSKSHLDLSGRRGPTGS